jgi:hypothetical protein
MGNLLAIEERLEEFPSRAPFSNGRDEDRKNHRGQFPWVRANRYLESRVGQHWDKVVSEFTHAEWIPKPFRTYTQLAKMVEVDTFIHKGEICYYTDYHAYDAPVKINETRYHARKLLYVHPKSKVLSLAKVTSQLRHTPREDKRTFVNRYSLWGGEHGQFIKIKGIWYEVWGKPYSAGSVFYKKKPDTSIPMLPADGDTCLQWDRMMKTGMKVTAKYQMNKQELIANFLQNAPYVKESNVCKVCGGSNCRLRHNLVDKA